MLNNIGRSLKVFIKKNQFNPGVLGFFINPFYFVRRSIYLNIKKFSPEFKGEILDIGCGAKPYEKLFINSKKYIGVDLESSGHDHSLEQDKIFYDGKHIPFDDNHFDGVVCFEVLEHVFDPDEFLIEIGRVLKKNKNLLITVPFVWDEHEIPYDYGRYTSFGLKHLLEKNGFEIIESRKMLSDLSFFSQLFNSYIYKEFTKIFPKIIALPLILLISILSNIIGIFLKLFHSNDFYYGNIVIARKK